MKNIRIKLFAVSLICIGLTGLKAQTVKDIDGNVYHTVTIGTQVWMVENLKTTKYNDGTSIPNITDNSTWANLKTSGYCWFNNDAANKNIYGALYNWHAVNTGNLAPKGWHVSSEAEWTTLIIFLGGESIAAGKLKETGTSHWQSPNTGATNETGFSALPGGNRRGDGAFFSLGRHGFWWSSVESTLTSAWFHWVCNDFKFGNMGSGDSPKECGFSVRCIRDNNESTILGEIIPNTDNHDKIKLEKTELKIDIITDIEGNVYHTVKIGGQVWMVENLKSTKYNDGTSIPNITDNSTWANLKSPGYCWFNNDATNKNIYGALYNWHTVNTGKLAPKGWHVPTDAEWTTLITKLGGESVAGGKLKEIGISHWQNTNNEATNETGFTALPGGYRNGNSAFLYIGSSGGWWSSSEGSMVDAWYRFINDNQNNVYRVSYGNDKEFGFSVRCVRD